MKEYFLGLIAFAFIGSIIFSLVPSGTPKRYVRLLCGLCSVGCIAFPIFELMNDHNVDIEKLTVLFEPYNEIDENTVKIYNNSLNSAALKNAEESLKNDIIKEISANYEDIDVCVDVKQNGDDFYINKVLIYIYPSGYAKDPKRIKAICENRFSAECEIIYR